MGFRTRLLPILQWNQIGRPTKKQLASNQGKRLWREFLLKKFGALVLLFVIGTIASYFTFKEQRIHELSQFNGVLYPANDPDPPTLCTIPDSALRVFVGKSTIFSEGQHIRVIARQRSEPLEDIVLLGIERTSNGTLALTAHIVGEDQKVIMDIDSNHFEVNRNMILDSLSPPRPDLSTIVLKDEYGNKLKVRFINKHSVTFQGKVYYRPGYYIEAYEEGFKLIPPNSGVQGNWCWEYGQARGRNSV
jgi:hypothetical protein